MRKLFLIISACLVISCEQVTEDQVSTPQMVKFYQESMALGTVAADSVQRFATKVDGYVTVTPSAVSDPLYPDIMQNIRTASISITVPGFEDVEIHAEF